MYNICGSKEIL